MFRFIPVHDRYGKTGEGSTIKAALDAAFDSERWYWDISTGRGSDTFRFGFLDDQPITAPRFNGKQTVPLSQGDQVIGRLESL